MHATVQVDTQQLPVGQGGLMTCSIECRQPHANLRRFHFVFDCGSINKEHLRESLNEIETRVLDILFISHLDADHVNCIDMLLERMTVETVVLPCLDPLQVTAIVCESLNGSGMTGDFRSFLQSPNAWFAQRGVKQVIYVSRDIDGDNGAPPFAPGDGPPQYGRPLSEAQALDDRLKCELKSFGMPPAAVRTRSGTVQFQLASAANSLEVDLGQSQVSNNSRLTWLLIPYVHPFPQDRIDAFRQAVKSVVRIPRGEALATSSFVSRLLDVLKEETKRSLLKSCYSILSADNNKPSLSLYSGPYPRGEQLWTISERYADALSGYGFHNHRYLRRHQRIHDGGGWMCTGDADLRSKGTRTPWLRMYGSLLERLSIFVLPHHGSNSSIHDDVLTSIGHAITVACAAKERVHHPHPKLVKRLSDQQTSLWHVSEDHESALSLRVLGH